METEARIQPKESIKSFGEELPRRQDFSAFYGMASLRVLRTLPQSPSPQA